MARDERCDDKVVGVAGQKETQGVKGEVALKRRGFGKRVGNLLDNG